MKKSWVIYGIVILIIIIALIFRIVNIYPIVFPEDGHVYLLGIDPIFYLRQVETTVRNFPYLQKFDHATHYPGGLVSDATGLYVWAVAGITRLIYGSNPSSDSVAGFMAWIPILFSALSYLLVFRIAGKLRNEIAGIFAIFLLLVYPGLFLHRGIIGFPDHHILEVFFALWLMNSLLNTKVFVRNPKAVYIPIVAAIPLFLFFTVWPGAHLYILLSGMVLIILSIIAKKEDIKSIGYFGIFFFTTSAIGYYLIYFLIPDLITSSFSKYDSKVGIIMFGSGLLILAGSYFIAAINQKINPKIYQPILFIFLVLGIALFFHYTQIGKEILERLTFKATGVAENQAVGWVNFLDMVLISGVVSAIYLVYLTVLAFIGRLSKMTDIVFVFLSGFFIFMWMSTYDMGYMIAPFISIVAGVALYDFTIWSIKMETNTTSKLKKLYQSIPYILIGICFILPILRSSAQYPYSLSSGLASTLNLYKSPWIQAMDWLRTNTPELAFPTDAVVNKKEYDERAAENYSVLSAWDNGNIINQRGHRIPMWSRWPGDKIESLMLYPPDSLKNFLLSTKYPVDYLIVDDRMASIFFMSKYQLMPDFSVENCMDTTVLEVQGREVQLSNYDPCYKESLIYKTYIEKDTSLTWINQVYASDERVVIGYLINEGILILRNIEYDFFNEEQLEALRTNDYILSRQGIFYDVSIVPQIQIFKINKAMLKEELQDEMK